MPRAQERNGRAEDRVFNAILDAVLDHRLAPGTKLTERELTEIFGVSRGAVRGALTRLGHSLLVELRPNRGAVIANPSSAETPDLFEARRVIESALMQRLARNITATRQAFGINKTKVTNFNPQQTVTRAQLQQDQPSLATRPKASSTARVIPSGSSLTSVRNETA